MSNFLIKFASNYADEFDVEGFTVMSEDKWFAHKDAVTSRFENEDEIEVYFGTNESIIYESLDSYLSSFKITELTDEEHSVLQKLFGPSYIGSGMIVMIET